MTDNKADDGSKTEATLDPRQLKVPDLRAELEKRGLDKTGRKADLVKRLADALNPPKSEEPQSEDQPATAEESTKPAAEEQIQKSSDEKKAEDKKDEQSQEDEWPVHADESPDARKATFGLFVGDLHSAATADDLKDTFAEFGAIVTCSVDDNKSGSKQRAGFVQFVSREARRKALDARRDVTVLGELVRIKVQPAQATLAIRGLPRKDIGAWKVRKAVQDIIPAHPIKDVRLEREGHAKVIFYNDREAAQALGKMRDVRAFGRPIKVSLSSGSSDKPRARSRSRDNRKESSGSSKSGDRDRDSRRKSSSKAETSTGGGKKPRTKTKPGAKKVLWMTNLVKHITEDVLRARFSKFGEIVRVSLIKDRNTGKIKFVFLEYTTPAQACAALDGMNRTDILGLEVRIELCQKKMDGGGPPQTAGHKRDRDSTSNSSSSNSRDHRNNRPRAQDDARFAKRIRTRSRSPRQQRDNNRNDSRGSRDSANNATSKRPTSHREDPRFASNRNNNNSNSNKEPRNVYSAPPPDESRSRGHPRDAGAYRDAGRDAGRDGSRGGGRGGGGDGAGHGSDRDRDYRDAALRRADRYETTSSPYSSAPAPVAASHHGGSQSQANTRQQRDSRSEYPQQQTSSAGGFNNSGYVSRYAEQQQPSSYSRPAPQSTSRGYSSMSTGAAPQPTASSYARPYSTGSTRTSAPPAQTATTSAYSTSYSTNTSSHRSNDPYSTQTGSTTEYSPQHHQQSKYAPASTSYYSTAPVANRSVPPPPDRSSGSSRGGSSAYERDSRRNGAYDNAYSTGGRVPYN